MLGGEGSNCECNCTGGGLKGCECGTAAATECCGGETGCACGNCKSGAKCCCCPGDYSPNGPNCSCVYTPCNDD